MYFIHIAVTVFVNIFAVIAALFAYWKRSWIATDGVIIRTEMEPSENAERHCVIHYQFNVDEVEFSGDDTVLIEAAYQEDALRAEYAPGMRLEVYYAPQAPRFNSARRNVAGLQKILFGAVLTALSVIVIYYL